MTLTRQNDRYQVNNPTPYYITLIDAAPNLKADGVTGFKPRMIAPKGQLDLGNRPSSKSPAPCLKAPATWTPAPPTRTWRGAN